MKTKNNPRIAIIGLGYVGLPLAQLFATRYEVHGFDTDKKRIDELKAGLDHTQTIQPPARKNKPPKPITFTHRAEDIRPCNIYIITVPTPADRHNRPDLGPLKNASMTVGRLIDPGDYVIFESTVYPGATEDDCLPIIEAISGLTLNTDFYAGYSPERINPGDMSHTIEKIKKVTSGSTPAAAATIDALYRSVITAGTHRAPSIRVAEAAKIIENCQRDINIAFVNELKKIFDRMNINTAAVLEAASTKWNVLPFKPGLVGGHCIGVDPYYLAQQAQAHGYHPEIILAGRRLNDSMPEYICTQVIKRMIRQDIPVRGARILILGITFKPDCPDVRNTKVVPLIRQLREYDTHPLIYDPWANPIEVRRQYRLELLPELPKRPVDAIILAVPHTHFSNLDLAPYTKPNSFIYSLTQ
jgi:UDP-N-acetyl-D-galactosamine dehydrogenase